jgi:hypothetical protein
MIITHTPPTHQILEQMVLAHFRPHQYLLDFPNKIQHHILRKSIAFPLHVRWCLCKFNLPTNFHHNQWFKRMTDLAFSLFPFEGN